MSETPAVLEFIQRVLSGITDTEVSDTCMSMLLQFIKVNPGITSSIMKTTTSTPSF